MKKFVTSNLSEQEAYLLVKGDVSIGISNVVTILFMLIGKYSELDRHKCTKEIVNYNPINDCRFKYENRGYSEINKLMKKNGIDISRRHLKCLSRKWPMSRVRVSYETVNIMRTMFLYINERQELVQACSKFVSLTECEWNVFMPIQYEFLGIRIKDQFTDWEVARDIVIGLSKINLEK